MKKIAIAILGLFLLVGTAIAAPTMIWSSLEQEPSGEVEYTFLSDPGVITLKSSSNGTVGLIYDVQKFKDVVFRIKRGEMKNGGSSYVKNGKKCSWHVKATSDWGYLITTKVGNKIGKVYIPEEMALDFQIAVEGAK